MKRAKTPTFLIELPLQVDWSSERPLRAHLEAARCLYNALLSEANRRLQRKMERQRRANNPEHYDEKGCVKKQGKKRLWWNESQGYKTTRRQHAAAERTLAAHRKSLHGKLAHDIVKTGNTLIIEKTSFVAWQKQYGRSIGLRAPGMFVAHLTRIVAKTGGTLSEVSAFKAKLSQYCHACGAYIKKSRSRCAGTTAPVAVDQCNAIWTPPSRLSHLHPEEIIPSITQSNWEGTEPCLRAVMEGLQQRANEGQILPPSMGIVASGKAARAGARRLERPAYPHQEPLSLSGKNGNVE